MMNRLFTKVFLGMGIACLGLSTRINAQSLLISNSIEQPRQNIDEKRLTISPHLPYFCDSTGKCYSYVPYEIPTATDKGVKAQQVDAATMRSFKKLLLNDFRNQIRNLNVRKDELNKQMDSIQSKQAILYYQINNMSIVLDTSHTSSDKNSMFDSLAYLAGDLHAFKMKLDHTHEEILKFIDVVSTTTLDTLNRVTAIKQISETAPNNLEQYHEQQREINVLFERVQNIDPRVLAEVVSLKKTLVDHLLTRYNVLVKKYVKKQKAKPVEKAAFGALPSLNSVLGTRQLVPNIDIHGSTKFDSIVSKYAELRFFTGSIGSSDVPSIKTIFFTETSTWGLSGKFTWGFAALSNQNGKKTLGINLEAHYLVKRIKFDTLTASPTFSPGVFHFKAGVEYLLLKDILSGYANINTLTFTDNLAGFSEQFDTGGKNIYGFIDFGIKMLLDMNNEEAKNAGFKLLVSFGGVVNGGDVKHFTNSKDLIIPTIRLGLRKDLGF